MIHPFVLSFVRVFRESNIGFLPVSSSGKLLQEVITTTPNVSMVGVKPSNIYVTLGGKDLGRCIIFIVNQWYVERAYKSRIYMGRAVAYARIL